MKTIRALTIGSGIWAGGVALFTISYWFPLLENADLQANLVLIGSIPVLVWLGSAYYYRKDKNTHGFKVGLLFILVAALLDALITVPFLLAPFGVTHLSFFTDPGFWAISVLFVGITMGYYYRNVRQKTKQLNN